MYQYCFPKNKVRNGTKVCLHEKGRYHGMFHEFCEQLPACGCVANETRRFVKMFQDKILRLTSTCLCIHARNYKKRDNPWVEIYLMRLENSEPVPTRRVRRISSQDFFKNPRN